VSAWLHGDPEAAPVGVEAEAAAPKEGDSAAGRQVVDMRGVSDVMGRYLATARENAEGGLLDIEAPIEAMAEELGLATPKYGDPAVVMDLETLALRSAPIFLVGMLDLSTGRVRQTLAADYAGEVEMLTVAAATLREGLAVITYNGTTFDLPYLRERMAYWRLGALETGEHRDLLRVLRAMKTGRPSLKLTAVEEWMLGRVRAADVDGAELPERYKEFVDGGVGEILAPALAHNLMDLWSCAEIHALLKAEG
jgi:hypothetical protein